MLSCNAKAAQPQAPGTALLQEGRLAGRTWQMFPMQDALLQSSFTAQACPSAHVASQPPEAAPPQSTSVSPPSLTPLEHCGRGDACMPKEPQACLCWAPNTPMLGAKHPCAVVEKRAQQATLQPGARDAQHQPPPPLCSHLTPVSTAVVRGAVGVLVAALVEATLAAAAASTIDICFLKTQGRMVQEQAFGTAKG